eukprot:Colp12_sorted_trinity150504_noHs@32359
MTSYTLFCITRRDRTATLLLSLTLASMPFVLLTKARASCSSFNNSSCRVASIWADWAFWLAVCDTNPRADKWLETYDTSAYLYWRICLFVKRVTSKREAASAFSSADTTGPLLGLESSSSSSLIAELSLSSASSFSLGRTLARCTSFCRVCTWMGRAKWLHSERLNSDNRPASPSPSPSVRAARSAAAFCVRRAMTTYRCSAAPSVVVSCVNSRMRRCSGMCGRASTKTFTTGETTEMVRLPCLLREFASRRGGITVCTVSWITLKEKLSSCLTRLAPMKVKMAIIFSNTRAGYSRAIAANNNKACWWVCGLSVPRRQCTTCSAWKSFSCRMCCLSFCAASLMISKMPESVS